MWSEITNSWKYHVFSTEEIENETLQGLCEYSSIERSENMQIAERFYNVKNKVSEWSDFFEGH